jgi:hypothetical protein
MWRAHTHAHGRCRWRLFKRWQTRYFTLSSAALTYCDGSDVCLGRSGHAAITVQPVTQAALAPSIDLRTIRSVRSLSQRRRRSRSKSGRQPCAFEIFTDDRTDPVVLKVSYIGRPVCHDTAHIHRQKTAHRVWNG